jgi:predicted RNA-binding Zn ribbon-like protein
VQDEQVPETALLLAFAATLDVEDTTDAFTDEHGLAAWLRGRELLGPAERVDAAHLGIARALRDAVRQAMLAHHDGMTDPGTAARLDALAAELPVRLAFSAAGSITLEPAAPSAHGALARIVAAIATAHAHGQWTRLKLCPADDCQVPFYDRSRNHSRRWCDMAVCGGREKARAYRARKAAG